MKLNNTRLQSGFSRSRSMIFLMLVTLAFACQKENETPANYDFDFFYHTIDEDAVGIEWSDIDPKYKIRFQIDEDADFQNPLTEQTVDADQNQIILSGLEAISEYILKIEVLDNQLLLWSNTYVFTTGYTIRPVKFKSTDNVLLCAELSYISSRLTQNSKTVILMHEFTRNKGFWNKTHIIDTLVREGYLCLALDFRGHGCSTFDQEITTIVSNPSMVMQDYYATIVFLDTLSIMRSNDLIVLGGSMGACVATAASSEYQVLGGIAASATEYMTNLMYDKDLEPKKMFYIAGELDKNSALNIDYEKDAHKLASMTKDTSKVWIQKGSSAHGIDLLYEEKELLMETISWIRSL